jgi:hypothetical protein
MRGEKVLESINADRGDDPEKVRVSLDRVKGDGIAKFIHWW